MNQILLMNNPERVGMHKLEYNCDHELLFTKPNEHLSKFKIIRESNKFLIE